jgi:tRNA threonylcarbamoyladenosine biosynthesis protein TsaE
LPSILETHLMDWPNEAACSASAEALARALRTPAGIADAFIELHGPLGAGKTTFVRHLLHALGVQGRVKSPTYTVVEPYELARAGGAPLSIWHFDFYRFDDPQEWEDAGFRDLFASPGLKLAEWPEKAEGLLPTADLQLHIEPLAGDRRSARFTAGTALGTELLRTT